MKIFLDDNRSAPEGWERAHTADEAKLHLIFNDVEQMSLDHDLDAPTCDRCEFKCGIHEPEAGNACKRGCDCHAAGAENGLDLLYWMRDTGRWPKQKPVVHSANLDGSLRMKAFVEKHWPGNEAS